MVTILRRGMTGGWTRRRSEGCFRESTADACFSDELAAECGVAMSFAQQQPGSPYPRSSARMTMKSGFCTALDALPRMQRAQRMMASVRRRLKLPPDDN